ncbi:MAG TPA: DUF177 domain-containing protein [Gaiellaceae bacterium]|nr:DUF177 domain-containing protein [Gaiellaceae bacterium]
MAHAIDLRRLRLRPGEVRREILDLEAERFLLGGQRYETAGASLRAELDLTRASGALVLDLRLETEVSGPCMRCLGAAAVDVSVRARELHDPRGAAGDPLRSEYVLDEMLDVAAWARDAVALALPEPILCRPECAGLCAVCGRDLNVEPHEHAIVEADPRWAALERLRGEL